MKYCCYILCAVLFCASLSTSTHISNKLRKYQENIVLDDNGEVIYAQREKRFDDSTKSATFSAEYWLYTKQNRVDGQKIDLNDSVGVANSYFNASSPTRFIIHGWNDNANTVPSILIRSSYLDRRDFNVFAIDWSNGVPKKSYIAARNEVTRTANQVADFIFFLKKEHQLNLDNSYLIGHNLGAHIAGLIGKRLQSQNSLINAIIGLDPAWPMFSVDRPESRLSKGDAKFVMTIQTSGDRLGFHWPIGDADFFPNWGRQQPACSYDSTGHCSDGLAVQYFALSLLPKNDFLSKPCENFENIRNGKCRDIIGNDQYVEMAGDPLNVETRGVFYLPVDDKYPFSVGKFSDESA